MAKHITDNIEINYNFSYNLITRINASDIYGALDNEAHLSDGVSALDSVREHAQVYSVLQVWKINFPNNIT